MTCEPGDRLARYKMAERALKTAVKDWRYGERGCPRKKELACYFKRSLPIRRTLPVWWHVRGCALCRADLLEYGGSIAHASEYKRRFPAAAQSRLAWGYAAVATAIALVASVLAVYNWQEKGRPNGIINESSQNSGLFKQLPVTLRSETISRLEGLEASLPQLMRGATFKTYLTLGTAFLSGEQFERAIEFFEKAKQTKPNDDEPYKALAAVYKIQGAYDKCVSNLEQVLKHHPNDSQAWNYMGWSYYLLKQYDRAYDAYLQALRIQPDYADAYFNLALLERQRGKAARYQELVQKARQLLLRSISNYPDYAGAYFELAKTYASEMNREQALFYVRTAITKDPEWAFWIKYETFFEDIIKPFPEEEKTIAAFADVYMAFKVKQILASLT